MERQQRDLGPIQMANDFNAPQELVSTAVLDEGVQAIEEYLGRECDNCRGTGTVTRYRYGGSSDEGDWAGEEPCYRCGRLRRALQALAKERG